MKTCKVCKIQKELTEFHPCGKYKEKIYYRGECRECNKTLFDNKEACKKYRQTENGKDKRKEYKKTEKAKEYNREYDRKRGLKPERKQKQYLNLKRKLNEDPFFRLKHNLRNVIEFIGCGNDELKAHIQSLFTEGMTWDNYGHGKDKWTLDHKKPLSSAKTEQEMYDLCHYLNLQPMWYIDNIKKGNK